MELDKETMEFVDGMITIQMLIYIKWMNEDSDDSELVRGYAGAMAGLKLLKRTMKMAMEDE